MKMKTNTIVKSKSLQFGIAAICGLVFSGAVDAESGSRDSKGAPAPKSGVSRESAGKAIPSNSKSKDVASGAGSTRTNALGAEDAKVKAGGASSGRGSEKGATEDAYFRRLDGDGDGRLTYDEYVERRSGRKVASEMLRAAFEKMDSNRNGYCTPAEFIRGRNADSQSTSVTPNGKGEASGKAKVGKEEPDKEDAGKENEVQKGSPGVGSEKSGGTKASGTKSEASKKRATGLKEKE